MAIWSGPFGNHAILVTRSPRSCSSTRDAGAIGGNGASGALPDVDGLDDAWLKALSSVTVSLGSKFAYRRRGRGPRRRRRARRMERKFSGRRPRAVALSPVHLRRLEADEIDTSGAVGEDAVGALVHIAWVGTTAPVQGVEAGLIVSPALLLTDMWAPSGDTP